MNYFSFLWKETDSSESNCDFSPSEEEYLPEKTTRDKDLSQRCKSQRLNRAKTAVAKKKNVQVVQVGLELSIKLHVL